jgi:hypothetical protein
MSSFGDWYRQTPHAPLDDSTADRILAGKVCPDDAPPGYAGLAVIAEDLTQPAMATELAGETVVVEAMRAVSTPHKPKIAKRRKAVLAKRLTAKIAAVALAGTFGLGWAAAAAAGALPGQGGAAHHGRTGPISGTRIANTRTASTRSAPAATTTKPHTRPQPAQRPDPTVTTSPPSTIAGTEGSNDQGDVATETENENEDQPTSTTMPTSTTTPSQQCDDQEGVSTPAATCGDDDESTSTTMPPASTTVPSSECDDQESPSTTSATCGEHESDQEDSTTSTTVSSGPDGGGD